MEKIKMTNARVRAIGPQSKLTRYSDQSTPYLMLRVTANGAKTFVYFRRVGGKLLTIAIGGFPAISVDLAQKRTEQISGRIAHGLPPVEMDVKTAETFGDVFESYMTHYAKPNKRSWKKDQQLHDQHIKQWDKCPVDTITNPDVRTVIAVVGEKHQVTANRLLALIKKVFNFAIDDLEMDLRNPARRIKKFREEARKRYMNEIEAWAFLQALETLRDGWLTADPDYVKRANVFDWVFWGDFFTTLLFTGSRSGSLKQMQWSQLDLDQGVWMAPASIMKGDSAVIVLARDVVDILKSRRKSVKGVYVFPGRNDGSHIQELKRPWTELLKTADNLIKANYPDEKIDITTLTPHDLRRTFGTWQLQGGASMATVRDSLSHKNITVTQTAYAHVDVKAVRSSVENTVTSLKKHRS